MIYLLTGQPGHGKTLRGLEMALEYVDKGRTVYAAGTPGLDYEKAGFQPLPDPKDWQSLPDNSVVFLDECYTAFPNRAANSTPPPHVEALARHRHRGFDFILICQLGNQVDPFLRGLVDQHTHVRRKFGWNVAVLKTWDHFEPNPLKTDGSNKTWKLSPRVKKADLYVSTTQDTTSKRLPWYYIAAPILLAYVGYVFWDIKHGGLFADDKSAPVAAEGSTGGSTAASAAGVPTGAPQQPSTMTPDQYVRQFVPRLEGAPWSAPIYDGRRAAADPVIACMASGHDGQDGCNCMTEQGTRVEMTRAACYQVARYGPVYNPFKRPEGERRVGNTRSREEPADARTAASSELGGADVGAAHGDAPRGAMIDTGASGAASQFRGEARLSENPGWGSGG